MTEVNLKQVLVAYDYAESHPHKYLRGTTNWCAAVAHSLNHQLATLPPAHIEYGEEVEVVAWQHPQYLERLMTADHKAYNESREGAPATVAKPYTVALMTVAQHQRIVAARASKAAARVEDEREALLRDMVAYFTESGLPEDLLERYRSVELAALSSPPAAGTTSDQYRAELYDEVWQKARDMGYGNVTDALVELERIKAVPPAAGVPESVDPCPGCLPGGICRTPTCGRLVERSKRKYGVNISDAPSGFKRPATPPPAPPASEQQRAEADLLNMIDQHRIELLPEYDAGYTAVAYGDSDQPVARADGMTAREAIAELLRLNPHLAKGEGV